MNWKSQNSDLDWLEKLLLEILLLDCVYRELPFMVSDSRSESLLVVKSDWKLIQPVKSQMVAS